MTRTWQNNSTYFFSLSFPCLMNLFLSKERTWICFILLFLFNSQLLLLFECFEFTILDIIRINFLPRYFNHSTKSSKISTYHFSWSNTILGLKSPISADVSKKLAQHPLFWLQCKFYCNHQTPTNFFCVYRPIFPNTGPKWWH